MRATLATILIAVCVGGGWYLYQLNTQQGTTGKVTRPVPVPAVEVTQVQRRLMHDRAELVGNLEADSEVEIHTRASGYITKLPFSIGDFVQKGKVVVEVDDSAGQELVARAQAALHVAEAQLQSQKLKADLAERDLHRRQELSRKGVATPQQLEEAQADLAVAQSQVELEKAHVLQAQADLLRSKLSLEESHVVAPLSGYVAEKMAEVGDLAQPDKPILKLVRLDLVRTVVHVGERDYEKVLQGQQADIQVDAFPHRMFQGKIVRKAPVLEPETRTAAVHINIQNDRVLLKPGMHARVTLTFRKATAERVIPVDAMFERDNRPQVFVVRGSPPRLHLQEIVTGVIDGSMVEILSGLTGLDRVVTLGSRLVKEGQEVQAVETPVPADARSSGESPVQTAHAPIGG